MGKKLKINGTQNILSMNCTMMEILVVAILLVAYLINIPLLILAAFSVACVLVLFSDCEKSIYYIAFFTSFSRIFTYQGRYMFFVVVALFIIKFIFFYKVQKKLLIFYLVIVLYSFLFCDKNAEISFAKLIGIILLLAISVIASFSHCIDGREFMKNYILGFVISTIIGFYVTQIPALLNVFEYDLIWTEHYEELTRFFGLAYDSNFYALSNYIILAYLLMAFKKLNLQRTVLILFLIFAGLQTFSKSYLLVMVFLIVLYFLRKIKTLEQLLFSLAIVVAGVFLFHYITNMLEYNMIDMILNRFVEGGSFADNTTGRVEIWEDYFSAFNDAGISKLLFGFGFNTNIGKAAHNTFIEFLYFYGIVGIGIWLAYFIYCVGLFRKNTKHFEHKTYTTILVFVIGIFFLSAYTYEGFWMGIVISLLTFGKSKEIEYINEV